MEGGYSIDIDIGEGEIIMIANSDTIDHLASIS